MIDIIKTLEDITIPYAIMKRSYTWPVYKTYSDIDILTANKYVFSHELEKILKKLYTDIKLNIYDGRIDIIENKQIDLRYDIIDSLDYEQLKDPLKTKRDILCNNVRVDRCLFCLEPLDQMIRLLEYVKYRYERPDKIKHLHYVRLNRHNDLMNILKEHCSEVAYNNLKRII